MKHMIRSLFMLATIFIFVGCATQQAVQTTPMITVDPISSPSAGTQGWQSLPTFTSLDAYEEYIADRTNIERFLTYEDIKVLGDFHSYIDFGYPKCHKYKYGLIDKNGYRVALNIYPISQTETAQNNSNASLSASKNQDMRTTLANIKSHAINEIEYAYYEGELRKIAWITNSFRFVVEGDYREALSEYPTDRQSSFLQRLLNEETAEAAVAEFNTMVAQALAKKTS